METLSRKRHHLLDELLSSVTHGVGVALSVVGTVVLITAASRLGDLWKIVSFSVFGASLILLYLASTLYHSTRHPKLRQGFQMLDHCAIFLLIAGTYTPFLLVNMRGPVGWTLFGVIWGLALTGVILKLIFGQRYKLARVIIYLTMGWLIIFASSTLVETLSSHAIGLTLAGGIIYTLGVIFYLGHRIPFNHAIWHLFVMAGSACHFYAVYYGVLPFTLTLP